MAKRQEVERLAQGGDYFRIPFSGAVCKYAPPRLEAVKLSITTLWSNGPIEGHIHRLKAVKRQIYGRADFELKGRVLPWDVTRAA